MVKDELIQVGTGRAGSVDTNKPITNFTVGRQRCVNSFRHQQVKATWIHTARDELLKTEGYHSFGS